MSHSLIVKLRLGNTSEGNGYYRKGFRKSLLQYSDKMEPEFFWLFVQEARGEMPFVSSNVASVGCGLHCSRGDLLPILPAA